MEIDLCIVSTLYEINGISVQRIKDARVTSRASLSEG